MNDFSMFSCALAVCAQDSVLNPELPLIVVQGVWSGQFLAWFGEATVQRRRRLQH